MMISQKMSSFESVSSDGDLCHSMCEGENYYETNGNYYTQLYPADSQQTGEFHILIAIIFIEHQNCLDGTNQTSQVFN